MTLTLDSDFDGKREDGFVNIPEALSAGKRALSEEEIAVLKAGGNVNSDSGWKNVLVSSGENMFDAHLIRGCEISGFLVLGRLIRGTLQYHDLVLETGLYDSYLRDVCVGDDVVIRNVKYLANYRAGSRVILFNIKEMSATKHCKFGNGVLKEGEPEKNRIWIGVCNENDKRAVLPFEDMITADAFIWSRYRDDKLLQKRFLELTENGNSKAQDTFGIIGSDIVIKNTTLLKDVKVGDYAYIKGAFKLKNITILSSYDEPSQIGEGVELVNGIVGYGSRVFYQAVGVRFVIGRNCQLKYGARLLNSVLGDNSTVSCCEILNNLIFPFHEQHHNSSFLIASMVGGKSNIAAGATIGSNHNSRSADGEITAKRGFWPGLCSDFKHNSFFASFSLITKGSYSYELNIKYPFALVSTSGSRKPIDIIPAYWFLYNMYAIARNKSKFLKRDKRAVKVQHVEIDPFAPDTVQEIAAACDRLVFLAKNYLEVSNNSAIIKARLDEEKTNIAKDFLLKQTDSRLTFFDPLSQKKYGAKIHKPSAAYIEYRRIMKYYAVKSLSEYCRARGIKTLTNEEIKKISSIPLYTVWVNAGGQIIPEKLLFELFSKIKDGRINSWKKVHEFYDVCQNSYKDYQAAYAIFLLEQLYSRSVSVFTREIFSEIEADAKATGKNIYNSALVSRMKDYEDDFRMITFRNNREMDAVLGNISDNEFLEELKAQTEEFSRETQMLFEGLR